ncbi:MAG TPA: ABC transporter ATP-binding protein [Alphaproteobacteria bacterium]
MTEPRKTSAFHVYLRALREVRHFWPHLVLILVMGLAWTPIALVTPLPLKIIVDNVLGTMPLPGLVADTLPRWMTGSVDAVFGLAIGLSVLIAVATLAYKWVEWVVRENVAEAMVHGFRGKIFARALEISAPGRDAAATQDLAFRITCDSPALQWTAIYGFIPVITALTSLAGMLWVTAAISPKLAFLALVTAVPVIGLVHLTQGRLRREWHSVREKDSAVQCQVQEVLGNLRVVTTFGQERAESRRFLDRSRTSVRAKLRVIRMEGAIGSVLGLSTALGTTAILWLGVRDVQAQVLSVGDLLLVMGYVAQLYAPLQQIGMHIAGQQQAVASAERAFEVLDQEITVTDRPDAQARAQAIGHVRFEDVTFAYPGCPPVLRDVRLDVPAGTCVGIVGRTGSGKTTLVNMLVRLMDPVEGRVLLDGVDLRDWRLEDLRRQFAVVSQEPVLFSTTIAENIAYGRPGASMAEIIEAAKLARAHDFIARLPDGYKTKVGERGTRLSGGERQRVALARAFLKDAPILLLDEPTSAIDGTTEAGIVESMERLMKGRTTFMIAHRLATLRGADMIVRVEDGTVRLERPLMIEGPRAA